MVFRVFRNFWPVVYGFSQFWIVVFRVDKFLGSGGSYVVLDQTL